MGLNFKAHCLHHHGILSAFELLIVKCKPFTPFIPPNSAMPLLVSFHCCIDAPQLLHTELVSRQIDKCQPFVLLNCFDKVLTSLSRDMVFCKHQYTEARIRLECFRQRNDPVLITALQSKIVALQVE